MAISENEKSKKSGPFQEKKIEKALEISVSILSVLSALLYKKYNRSFNIPNRSFNIPKTDSEKVREYIQDLLDKHNTDLEYVSGFKDRLSGEGVFKRVNSIILEPESPHEGGNIDSQIHSRKLTFHF